MDFLYLSPEFPPYSGPFIRQLDAAGVRVWGIGEADFYAMSEARRKALKWYARADLNDLSAVERAVEALLAAKARLGVPGCFDLVESHNEQWLALEAHINQRYGIEGIRPDDLPRLKQKSVMKRCFETAGLSVAPGERIRNTDQALSFARQHGYPVILKPDQGVGAGGIHRVDDDDTLRRLLAEATAGYLIEAFVDGPIVSYDGLVDRDGRLLFENSLAYGAGVLEFASGKDVFFYVDRGVEDELSQIGRRLVKVFDIRRKFFHFEFFRVDGRYIPIEINCRPPGGAILDMMNYSVDDDLYAVYARMIAHGHADAAAEKKFYCGYVGRRDRGYRLSHDAVLARCGSRLVAHEENPLVFQGAMGRYRYLLRTRSLDDLVDLAADLLETA